MLAGGAMLAVDSRVDAILVYSRRLPSDPGFRAAADAEARKFDPLDSFASDQALYFTNSLEAAASRRTDR